MSVSPVCRMTIHLDTIAHNFAEARRHVGPRTRLMAVVKSDAYGHGMLPVARRLLAEGADALAVATMEEACILREARVTAPILVLGGVDEAEAREAVRLHVALATYDDSHLAAMQDEAARLDSVAHIHIKVDTGMARIGVRDMAELSALCDALQAKSRLKVEGIFTHFADALGDPDYTERQITQFEEAVCYVRTRGMKPLAHAAASSGIAAGERFHCDMVRPGIVLYGADVREHFNILPAQRLTTHPVRIAEIESGETVGYGRTFTARRTTRVMTLPVGYANGYMRLFSNRACALVEGKRAPVIGNVCMNQMMLDVTDIPAAHMGSEVVLLGQQGDEWITPDEMARWADTIPYELMINLGRGCAQRVLL